MITVPTETRTNLVGLPNGPTNKYFTERGYSQSYPWKMLKQSASGKTLTLARVKTQPDPAWKDKINFIPGGFSAQCSNQNQQTWLYDGIQTDHTITIRKNKRGIWMNKGVKFSEDVAVYFYDYNF